MRASGLYYVHLFPGKTVKALSRLAVKTAALLTAHVSKGSPSLCQYMVYCMHVRVPESYSEYMSIYRRSWQTLTATHKVSIAEPLIHSWVKSCGGWVHPGTRWRGCSLTTCMQFSWRTRHEAGQASTGHDYGARICWLPMLRQQQQTCGVCWRWVAALRPKRRHCTHQNAVLQLKHCPAGHIIKYTPLHIEAHVYVPASTYRYSAGDDVQVGWLVLRTKSGIRR